MKLKTADMGTRPGQSSPTSHQRALIKGALGLYDLGWRLAIPALRHHHRLAAGYGQRRLRQWADGPVDIWIQAASAGESYLASSLLAELRFSRSLRILVTTNTSQGMEILTGATGDAAGQATGLKIQTAYFPFDRPTLMARAVRRARPRLAVLLETELWPGHLAALKAAGIPIWVINGRLTPKSLKGYLSWPALWRRLSPDRILAVSDGDARRFSTLFEGARVACMPNMKFDRQEAGAPAGPEAIPFGGILNPDSPFLILGSVRKQEEATVAQMVQALLQRVPGAVIGLFPRHMHRVDAWLNRLDSLAVPCRLRSSLRLPAAPGSVVVWDVFGELSAAYSHCRSCFIGGSLAPLGGQNFLEPLCLGIRPVIGPHWKNFEWVGREIVEKGLVLEAEDWRQAVTAMVAELHDPTDRAARRSAAEAYIDGRRGGSAHACRRIEQFMQGD